RVLTVDGHDVEAIDAVFTEAVNGADDRPTVILARTRKGSGVSEVEDHENWHGKPFPQDLALRGIEEVGGRRNLSVRGPLPAPGAAATLSEVDGLTPDPVYELGEKVATRKAFGDALLALGGQNLRVVALDGEVNNSTHADEFAK